MQSYIHLVTGNEKYMASLECKILDNEINIDLSTAKITHCCKMSSFWPIGDEPIKKNSISKDIRTSMKKGRWHPYCDACKQDEEKGYTSYRQTNGDTTNVFDSLNVIIQLPSYCQASCFYCTDHLSSTIAGYGSWVDFQGKLRKTKMPSLKPKVEIGKIQDYIASLDPKRNIQLGFVGGEPFITDAFFDYIYPILEAALGVNPKRTVLIGATTNSHNRVEYTQRFYELIQQARDRFKSTIITDIAVSIENIESRAEWSRNLVWQDFITVLDVHLKNANITHFKPCWNFTCMGKPLGHFLKFIKDKKASGSLQFNYVNQHHLRPQVLGKTPGSVFTNPTSFFSWLDLNDAQRGGFDKFKHWLSTTEDLTHLAPLTAKHIYNVDKIRGTDFAKTFPELDYWYKENLNAL